MFPLFCSLVSMSLWAVQGDEMGGCAQGSREGLSPATSTLRMPITGPEAWLLLHPWDGLELATLNADGLKLMRYGPLRKTACWSLKDGK